MTDDKITLLSSLPLQAKPGYSLDICLRKMQAIVARAYRNIRPPFFRRLMGGVSKDHARSVVATCNADLTSALRVTKQIQLASKMIANTGDERSRHRAAALAGYCERLISASNDWRNRANDFEANVFGSERELLEQCQRLSRLQETLAKPIAGLVETAA
jgi:hypothetical protein|nr:hypothetical protein [Neorhizobium tomejilense]